MASDNELACNIRTLNTKNGMLMLFETIIGTVILGITLKNGGGMYPEEALLSAIFFVLFFIATTFRTFLFLLSFLISPMTADSIPKTVVEFLHNLVAFLLCGPTTLALLIFIAKAGNENTAFQIEILVAAGLGLLTSCLYLMSTFISYKSFKSS